MSAASLGAAPVSLIAAPAQGVVAQTDDLTILAHGMEYTAASDTVHYLWYHNRETEAGETREVYRVVRLLLLKYLPQDARDDPAFLDKMRTALTGLYQQRRAHYTLVGLLCGMWEPTPIGVAQVYGVVGLGADRETALRQADLGAAALQGALANFAQAVLAPLTVAQARWIVNAFGRMRYVSVVVGQPDERLAAKGGGRDPTPGNNATPALELGVTGQQGEMFLRALAAGQHEFLAPILAAPIDGSRLARLLAGIADETSVIASLQTGADSISAGIALPLSLSAQLGQSLGTAFGRMQGASQARSLSIADSRTHTVGTATTTGHTVTEGTAHTVGVAHSSGRTVTDAVSHSRGSGTSEGTAHTTGSAHTVGSAHTSGSFSSSSSSAGVSGGTAHTVTDASQHSAGGAFSIGRQASHTDNQGEAVTQGGAHTAGASTNVGLSGGVSGNISGGGSLGGGGIPASVQGSVGFGAQVGANIGWQLSDSDTTSHAKTTSAGAADSTGNSVGLSMNFSRGGSHSVADTVSSGWSYGSSSSAGSSSSDTSSVSDSTSQSDSVSRGTSQSVGTTASHSESVSSSTTHSSSDTVSHSESFSTAYSRSVADSTGTAVSRGPSSSVSDGVSVGRSLGHTQGFGLGLGAVPSFSLGQSFQWYDDQAIQLTQVLRSLQELYRRATLEGAFYTDFYILTATEAAAVVADSAVRQAFQGSGLLVVTPVQTRRLPGAEQEYLRIHAQAFAPSVRPEPDAATYELYRDSTTLLPAQLAAYLAPACFETGAAVTVVERVPPFAFYPDLVGDVNWGVQFATEQAVTAPTRVPVRLSRERFFHTAFCADSGFGKSVAAERLLLETTALWHTQTVVLDFGAGWRKLANAPQLAGRVQVLQLQPGGVAPFRWNPWQVGQRIRPELQLTATCEILQTAGRMGERQLGYLITAAEAMWREAGVLVNSDRVQADLYWGVVQAAEAPLIGAAAGTRLADLPAAARQALAVERSKVTGWADLLERLRVMLEGTPVTQTLYDKKTGDPLVDPATGAGRSRRGEPGALRAGGGPVGADHSGRRGADAGVPEGGAFRVSGLAPLPRRPGAAARAGERGARRAADAANV